MKKIVLSQEVNQLEDGSYKLIEVIEYSLDKNELAVLLRKTKIEKENLQNQINAAQGELEARLERERILENQLNGEGS